MKFCLSLGSILIRRGFAERPVSKKVATMKKFQSENKTEASMVEIHLPSVGEALKNVNISIGQPDPILQSDADYPEWIWSARGPCRAAIRSSSIDKILTMPTEQSDSSPASYEELSKLKKYLRSENRKAIRRNNSVLKSASQ